MKHARTGALLAALVTLAACSSHKQTVMTSNGPATITESKDDRTVTITGKNGTASFSKSVDPSTLGAPVYPGAVAQGAFSGSGKGESGTVATFTTTDDFAHVYAFYHAKMPAGSQKMKMESGGTSMAIFRIGEDESREHTTVTISGEKGTTHIQIAHGTNASDTQGN